jgi:protein-tyrosine phosphatase
MTASTSTPSALRAAPAGLHNFRNLGGLAAADGRIVGANVLYRSAGLHRLEAPAWDELTACGLRLICDLRGRNEIEQAPTRVPAGVRMLALDIRNDVRSDPQLMRSLVASPDQASARALMLTIYRRLPGAFANRLGRLFDALIDADVPALLHCAAGKDRTGFAVAMLLHALGVPRQSILEDYLRSQTDLGADDPRIPGMLEHFRTTLGVEFSARTIVPIFDVTPNYLQAAFDWIELEHGGPDAWLREACGLDTPRRERLRDALLTDRAPD